MAAEIERVTLKIGDSTVTIMPKRAPVGNSASLRGQTLALFQAPSLRPEMSPVEIVEHLQPHLPKGAHDLFFGTADPGGRPVTAVANLERDVASAVGRALGLSRILFWDGRRASLLECDAGSA